MLPLEVYKQFLLKVNKNDTNSNVKVPKSQFVLLFNEQKRKWLEESAKEKEDSDYIEDIEILLELDVSLTKLNSSSNKDNFKLPDNFFKRVNSYSLASKGCCSKVTLVNWFVKPKDLNTLLTNSNHNPSFEYNETLAIINNNVVSVYKDGFNIDEVFLTYYREPKDIDIQGYTKIDGTPSVDVIIDLDTKSIEEIIDATATEALRNYKAVEEFNLALQREEKNKTK